MMELEEKKMELINTKAELASRSTSAKSSEIHFDEKIGYEEDIKQLKASSIILKRKIEEQKLEIYNLNQNHQTEFEKQKLEGTGNTVVLHKISSVSMTEVQKWSASFLWSSNLYCPMQNSDKMAFFKTHPTL